MLRLWERNVMPFQRRILLGGMCGLLAAPRLALAAWPDRPIRYVVPVAPGGPTDIAARIVAAPLTTQLGQTVTVENRSGGAGNIGHAFVAQSAPDGNTWLMGSFSTAANPAMFNDLPFDQQRDLQPVTQITRVPVLFTVAANAPFRSVAEAVAAGKRGGLTWASAGIGTSGHLAGELFNRAAGIEVPAAHYRGAVPAFADVMAGRGAWAFENPQTAIPNVQAGRARVLAVTTRNRIPELPEVPTFIESGYPQIEVESWHGIFVRAGTPREITERIARETAIAVRRPEVQERFRALGVQGIGSMPDAFTAFFNNEMVKWGAVIRAAGIRAE
jgi:tripartite-type tricarboxylate transporter receptor subunit TctC